MFVINLVCDVFVCSTDLAPPQEQQVSEQTPPMSEDEGNVAEVYNPSDNDGSVVEEAPVAPEEKVVDEIENGPQMVADASSTIQEEVPKKSYASIVCILFDENLSFPIGIFAYFCCFMSMPSRDNLNVLGSGRQLHNCPITWLTMNI